MDNLEFWKSVQKTNPDHTKGAKLSGMNITAIDPQHQRMNATEKFGMFGKGWGVKDSVYSTETFKEITIGNYSAVFWYKDGGETCEFDISSNVKVAYTTAKGQFKVDDEWMKKCNTDALTKGLSALGFNADIFLGKFDDNKYVAEAKEAFKPKQDIKDLDAAVKAIKEGKTTYDFVLANYNVKNEEKAILLDASLEGSIKVKKV